MALNLTTKTPGMEALDQLFRIGSGPSSSHSMGPARASEIFLARNEKAARFRVTLFGSLLDRWLCYSIGGGKISDEQTEVKVAGLIGNVAKQNGSISGAEAGCQAEVGVASAMAAGAAAYLMGGSAFECEYAAQMSLEHCLGMTCDPINGLVQIPCIERNVVAANRALVSAELAMLSDGRHLVSFDRTVEVMLETGRDLPAIYRETSHGGLAASWRKMC